MILDFVILLKSLDWWFLGEFESLVMEVCLSVYLISAF